MKRTLCLFLYLFFAFTAFADNGYRLWLRYEPITNAPLLNTYKNNISGINFPGNSATLSAAKDELVMGLEGLLNKKIPFLNSVTAALVIGTPASSPAIANLSIKEQLA